MHYAKLRGTTRTLVLVSLSYVLFPVELCLPQENELNGGEKAQLLRDSDDSAIERISEKLSRQPDNFGFLVARGDVYMNELELSRLDRAILDYSRALSVAKNDVDRATALRKRGYALFRRLDRDLALQDYEASLGLVPDDPLTLCCRGELWHALGKAEDAEHDFNRAHHIAPENAIPVNNLGFLAEERGDLELAISRYTNAIELAPDYEDAYRNRAAVYFRQLKFDLALADQDKAIELWPVDCAAHVERGDTKAAMRNYQEAINDYNKAIELHDLYARKLGTYEKRDRVRKLLDQKQE